MNWPLRCYFYSLSSLNMFNISCMCVSAERVCWRFKLSEGSLIEVSLKDTNRSRNLGHEKICSFTANVWKHKNQLKKQLWQSFILWVKMIYLLERLKSSFYITNMKMFYRIWSDSLFYWLKMVFHKVQSLAHFFLQFIVLKYLNFNYFSCTSDAAHLCVFTISTSAPLSQTLFPQLQPRCIQGLSDVSAVFTEH